jgi:hypothetical protein
MARNVVDYLKDVILPFSKQRTDDNLADALRLALKFVVLTQAEYDALDPVDENTLYFISEDVE